MKIIDVLLQLKQASVEHEGLLLGVMFDEKAHDVLGKECLGFCCHSCLGTCPACGRVTDNKILGINIKKGKE